MARNDISNPSVSVLGDSTIASGLGRDGSGVFLIILGATAI
jgi:hypothetical protein